MRIGRLGMVMVVGGEVMEGLDQFYTEEGVARRCWGVVEELVGEGLLGAGEEAFFVEPCAGDGVFLGLLPRGRRVGLDLVPGCGGVRRHDFLRDFYRAPVGRGRVVVVGNPPFGKRGVRAVEFVNRGFEVGDTVAFVVPVIFRKFFVQRRIVAGARLIRQVGLGRCGFRVKGGGRREINTEFQVWTRRRSGHRDLRVRRAPPIAHADFVMHQYNNTREALKVFGRRWDFAVPSQGYQDYSRRETRAEDCEKHKQWMLFYAERGEVRERLREGIDFGALALRNTTTVPGFRKGDVVAEYGRIL